MVSANQTPDLVARVQKPLPAGIRVVPKKWHMLVYFGAGAVMTAAAGEFIAAGSPPGVYFAPLAVISAVPMYFRAAQIFNYFYRH